MLRPSVSLAALSLCLVLAGAASAHGDDRAERADRGERSDRAEREQRDRLRDAEKVSRDSEREARKASERRDRNDEASSSGSSSANGDRDDLQTSDSTGIGDLADSANLEQSSGDQDNGSDEKSDNSGSGSGDEFDDDSGSSGSADVDDDKSDEEDNSGSGNSDDDEGKDDDDADEDDDDDSRNEGKASTALVSDDSGHFYRDREVLILLPHRENLDRLAAAGFTVIEKRELRRDGAQLVRVGFAAEVKAREALSSVRSLYPSAAIDFSHVYTASAEPGGNPASALLPAALEDQRSDVSIAVIDGFSNDVLPKGVELKSFVTRTSDLHHGAQVMSVLLHDMTQIGEGHPKRLLAADIAERSQDSIPQASVYNLVDALDWAAAEGADLINISLVGPPNQILGTMLDGLQSDGVLVFAAVGNTGPASRPGFPAAYGSVIGVTAVSREGAPYLYAARGEEVELSAQGVELRLSPDTDALSGTSFAVPRVVALAAWLMSANQSGDHRQGLQALARDLGAPGRDEVYGFGLLPTPEELGLEVAAAPAEKNFVLRE